MMFCQLFRLTFVSLIEGRVNESEYEKFLQAYKIDLNGPYFVVQFSHFRK